VSCSRRRACLLLPLLLCACSRRQDAGFLKIAIPPFENLSPGAGMEWLGRGFGEMLRLELAGSRFLPIRVARAADAGSAGAAYVVEGYFFRAAGRFEARAGVRDVRTHRTVATATASATGGTGVIALSESIARQIDPAARPAGTRSDAAVESLVSGAFDKAIAADPDFGAAYVAWVQSLMARGEIDEARKVIHSASARGGRFPAVERDMLALAAASLDNDAARRRQALVALTRSTPADPFPFAALAELESNARAFTSAIAFYRQALDRDPDNVLILNQLGYSQAYSGDLASAEKSISRYRELRPREANPLDSLGDVNYYLGQFTEAEKYYLAAHSMDPSFLAGGELYKAAWARLMTGDLAGADALFAKYINARSDALAPYRQAQWEYITGRRRAAMERLARLETQLAAAQLAVWQMETGDPAGARRNALRAGDTGLGAVVRYVTMPQGPPPPGVAGEYAAAYALLLSRQFTAAAGRLETLYARTPPGSSEPVEVLLAWALAESGHTDRAAALVANNPIPDATGEHLFLSLSFPRILYLRGDYKLFLRYSGDLPLIFGEEERARKKSAKG
jgi:tetratricopeptide (TPR) repeat protein